jgi:hypothetical protein
MSRNNQQHIIHYSTNIDTPLRAKYKLSRVETLAFWIRMYYTDY